MAKEVRESENVRGTSEPTPMGEEGGAHIIVYPFERYEIHVRVSKEGKFIDVVELCINKDFRSYKQRMTPQGFHDVEELYREE